MGVTNLLGCLLLGLWSGSAFEVELKELLNPAESRVRENRNGGLDPSCAPRGCTGIFTRDGSRSAGSRYGCTQQGVSDRLACGVRYRLNDDGFSRGTMRNISSVHVAFTADSETGLQILVNNNQVVVESWTGEKGSTDLQEIPGVAGHSAYQLELMAVSSEGSYIGITETEIYVEVDEVPVTGISASERVSVTASATVNDGSAGNTLDGITSKRSSWSCSEGDVCEITYDMQEVQSTQQLRIAFIDTASTAGAKFNVYTAGANGIFSSVISGAKAGPRDALLEDLQTFGGVRRLARYVKIEGVPASGGTFSISEVDIRVSEEVPVYSTTVDSSFVPLGRIPLGSGGTGFDPRPASEGGCTAGPFEGCHIYNIKDGDNSPNSRWSCSPTFVSAFSSGICGVEFRLNGQTYLRQIQLAFDEGDERHNEFSIIASTPGGPVEILSAISSGQTTDFQTWDIPAWTSFIELQPKFGSAAEWISIKEMILLGEEQSSDSTPIYRFSNSETGVIPTTTFSFDLLNVDSRGDIVLNGSFRTARVWAVRMKFPSNKSFTFDIRYFGDDRVLRFTRFTSAGGDEQWEEFVLPETIIVRTLIVAAVEGPDQEDHPALRVTDCQVVGEPYTAGSQTVASTTIEGWFTIPDYIGDGSGDQVEIMQAICDGIGEGFDGTDCDGVATGNDQTPDVVLLEGDYYVDGPVFMKSGISLIGERTEDGDSIGTWFRLHGSGTGADGMITIDGVSGVLVEDVGVVSNLEAAGPAGTVGNVGFDINDSEDITIDMGAGEGCPLAGGRFVNADRVRADNFYSYRRASVEGPEVVLDGVTDFILQQSEIQGAMIKDSVNVLFEGIPENRDLRGSIEVPEGGDQSANLVVTGTTSGVTLKDLSITSGAEPRIVLENSNPFTIDGVTFGGGTAGDCIIKFPQGSDGNAVLIQLNVEDELRIEGECFVLV